MEQLTIFDVIDETKTLFFG
ncbi:Protein of unknown function [Bacillus mycoides]|nr:Protein of unknown function [Bacillus mycoides]